MRKLLFLIILAVIFIACDKTKDPWGNWDENFPLQNESQFLILRGITNTGETHQGHPVYQYRIALSTSKYTGSIMMTDQNLHIPRVHGGQTVYTNPLNAPAFNITGRDHSWIEITVVCRVIIGAEEPLKFNISVGANPPNNGGIWFTALHLNSDDGNSNMNHIRFRTNGIDILNSANNNAVLYSLYL